MQGLSYGVVRVDSENSLTSLTLQDVGQVMPGAVMVVVKIDGPDANTEKPRLCKTDEVGELCVSSGASGKEYWVCDTCSVVVVVLQGILGMCSVVVFVW